MAHRLLSTLVFSSVTLLEGVFAAGCGGSHPVSTPEDPSDGATDVDVTNDGGSDVGSDAPDPRFCEPGWPTTKGQVRIEHEGVAYGCHIHDMDNPPPLSECCVIRPEDG